MTISISLLSLVSHTSPHTSQTISYAVMAATTTRRVENPCPTKLSLFIYLLPSLIRTVDCGFRYTYVLGYDAGDPYYDTEYGMKEVLNWFESNVESVMARNGIYITVKPVRVNNSIKKPGPVFIEMARSAYNLGAEYFYRVNDDSEFAVRWPSAFVASIKSLPAPYGVVGPLCL